MLGNVGHNSDPASPPPASQPQDGGDEVSCLHGCGRQANIPYRTCCQAFPRGHTGQCLGRQCCLYGCGRLAHLPYRTCCQACPGSHTRRCLGRQRPFTLARVPDAQPESDDGGDTEGVVASGDGSSGLRRSRSLRPRQRLPDSSPQEDELGAVARRLRAGGLTGQLLRLATAELVSRGWHQANALAALMDAGSQVED